LKLQKNTGAKGTDFEDSIDPEKPVLNSVTLKCLFKKFFQYHCRRAINLTQDDDAGPMLSQSVLGANTASKQLELFLLVLAFVIS